MGFLYILLALFIFGVLIFIHELGHFIAARLCGVEILEFAIGMGPKLISWRSKKTGTRYSLRLFPIGGYVSMLGESGMEAVQGSADMNDEADAARDEKLSEHDLLINETGEEDEDASQEPIPLDPERAKRAYCNQNVWKRIAISIAGPLMNVVLGFLLMLVMVLASGEAAVGSNRIAGFYVTYSAEEAYGGLQNGDYIQSLDGVDIHSFSQIKEAVAAKNGQTFQVTVLRLNEDGTDVLTHTLENVVLDTDLLDTAFTSSLSEQSGLQIYDEVIKVNGTSVHTYNELAYEIMNQGYKPLRLTVLRNGEKVVLENVLVPSYVDSGVTFGDLDFKVWREAEYNFATVLKHTWYRSVSTVKMVFDSLGGLFSGRYGVEAVSGPVGITKTISDAAQMGMLNVLYLITVISINLGVMNLLPFPALDGGHLLLYVVEIFRRKPVKPEVESIINFVGLIILLGLAVIIAIKDIIAL